ncbi:ABC transporter substrate-binding protein [Deinococcus sp. SL84]|uniref:ABC transporter substrate-binding protein n=1 Tax=Deinococcus sp. SL84 TaxID=2994663 RepID=UPI0022765116|nr:ABC transporter substrate-binding protein [Deinococcus sp. SL84]MCY1703952.1 ABC transporter substrate-binding protein [Deinococcus sp. SL84]
MCHDHASAFTAPYSRREFVRLAGLLSASAGSAALLGGCAPRQPDPDEPVRVGYLPITDAAPLLAMHGLGYLEAEGLSAEKPRLFRSWSQLVEAFVFGHVNVVHLLSPLPIWMRYSAQVPTRIVAWSHVDGSALTVAPDITEVSDLAGRTVALPFWYSVHNVLAQRLLREAGLNPVVNARDVRGERDVQLVVMAPSDMVPALKAGQIAGFVVAEPFGALAESLGVGRVQRLSGDVWKEHACCVVTMHDRDIAGRPDWTQKVVNALTRAQLWLNSHPAEAAHLLSAEGEQRYTPHKPAVLGRVLQHELPAQYLQSGAVQHPEWQERRIAFRPYPYPTYTEELVRQLREVRVEGDTTFLQRLDPAQVAREVVTDRFVTQAMQAQGGPAAFGLSGYSRTETFSAPAQGPV